jgi:HD-like signal output (HDOD) protein
MKRILFVDDEPNLLEGLQRMLRPQRREWEMTFVKGAEEALRVLERTAIDVVVTDMLMPGMDGARLLQQVHDRFPGVLRIVLSGHFDAESGLRAAPVAHQFLTKPCEPDKLKAAIDRSSQLGSVVPDEATRRLVGAIGALPSPPQTCVMLMEAFENADVSIETLAKIIDRDVAITAKLLQLVNSGFFGLGREVASVRAAINLLGLEVLKQLVLSAGVLNTFRPARTLRGFSLSQFEKHSQLTARVAGQLAGGIGAGSAGVLAGLLHDAGKLVLATCRPQEFERALTLGLEHKRPAHQFEYELLGTSHAEIGGYLLNLWGLPPATVDAITYHHRLSGPGFEEHKVTLRALIHVANALVHELDENSKDLPPFPAGAEADSLTILGVGDRIAEWRAMARKCVEKS